jgi:nitroimidazol reductase NimA-like FMN-containing flavoprotein (pyridoxamine 5'-phosphate oxidase superfamily)
MDILHPGAGSPDLPDDGRPRRSRKRARLAADARPAFSDLDSAHCHEILDRNRVGRIAYSFHDQVDITPVHYVRRGPWLYGRTSPGAKLVTLAHAPWVAFEVDEVEGMFDWRSVVVHGAFYPLPPGGTTYDVDVWNAGEDALRELLPETFTRSDPAAFREVMFRISIDRMTGRAAQHGEASAG